MIRALHYKIRCSNASWNIHSMGCEVAAKQYPNHDGRPPQHPEPGQSPAPSPLRPHPSDWCSYPKELRGSRSCFPVSILIRQLALSLQSFQSELLKHKPNYTPQPLLSLQWLPIPFRITSKSVPESLSFSLSYTHTRTYFLSLLPNRTKWKWLQRISHKRHCSFWLAFFLLDHLLWAKPAVMMWGHLGSPMERAMW